MSLVGIVSLGLSNLGSLIGALERIQTEYLLINRPAQLQDVDRVILPGVGSFSRAMQQLEAENLVTSLQDYSVAGKPIMGICLGMQLLAQKGQEGDEVRGLGLVDGITSKLAEDGNNRVPHMGWNSIEILQPHPVLDGIPNGSDFYFVHSYAIKDFKIEEALTTTTHGNPFLSGVSKSNIVGFQFHPEKSQRKGEKIIQNFIEWNGTC